MKKFLLFLVMGLTVMISPVVMNAEIKGENLEEALKSEGIEPLFEKYKEKDNQATVYFFRTSGEERSVAFLNYLNGIYKEHGKDFKVVTYEVSKNQDNYELMFNTIDYLGANVSATPFIVIGDAHFITYDESVNENVLKAITLYHENPTKVDKVSEVLVRYYRNETLMIGVVITVFISLIVLFVYATFKGRKN